MRPLLRALLLVALVGCRDAAPPTPAAPAQRIVSLAPNVTEIAFDIGLGPRIIGVSDFDTAPPEVASRKRLGGLLNPDLEQLTALQPDLILLHASANQVEEHARRLDLRAERFPSDTLADVEATYRRLGALTGQSDAAAQGLKRLQDGLGPAAPPRGVKVLLVVGRNPGTLENMTGVGPNTFLDELLTRAGATNVLRDAPTPWPQVDKEALLAADPDLILELSPKATPDPADPLAPWRQLGALKAVQQDRVRLLSGDHLLIPGPRLPMTAAALRDAVEQAAVNHP